MKKATYLVALALALVFVFAACANPAATTTPTAAPGKTTKTAAPSEPTPAPVSVALTDTPVTLTAYWGDHGYCALDNGYNDYPVLKKIAEITNVTLDITSLSSDAQQQIQLAFSTGDMPDLFLACLGGATSADKYGMDGDLIALNDLVEQYAPKIQAAFAEYPAALKDVTAEDGKYYTLPYIVKSPTNGTSTCMMIKTSWLEKTGKPVPKTIDDLEALLVQFRDVDMNGDGQTSDQIPLSVGNMTWFKTATKTWFGYVDDTIQGNVFAINKDGDLVLEATMPEYRAWLEYLAKLYSEKLLDNQFYTREHDTLVAADAADQLGAQFYSSYQDYAAWQYTSSLTSSYCPTPIAKGASVTGSGGGFAISSTNEYPELSIKWADIFFSKYEDMYAGCIVGFTGDYGVYGETFDVTEDNVLAWTYPTKEGGDPTFVEYLTYWGPGGLNFGYYDKMPFKMEGYMGWVSDGCALAADIAVAGDRIIPSALRFSDTDSDRKNVILTDIRTILAEQEARFITGADPINDSTIQSLVDKLNGAGAQEAYTLIKASMDKYYGK